MLFPAGGGGLGFLFIGHPMYARCPFFMTNMTCVINNVFFSVAIFLSMVGPCIVKLKIRRHVGRPVIAEHSSAMKSVLEADLIVFSSGPGYSEVLLRE